MQKQLALQIRQSKAKRLECREAYLTNKCQPEYRIPALEEFCIEKLICWRGLKGREEQLKKFDQIVVEEKTWNNQSNGVNFVFERQENIKETVEDDTYLEVNMEWEENQGGRTVLMVRLLVEVLNEFFENLSFRAMLGIAAALIMLKEKKNQF
jgi:hypothetical protein